MTEEGETKKEEQQEDAETKKEREASEERQRQLDKLDELVSAATKDVGAKDKDLTETVDKAAGAHVDADWWIKIKQARYDLALAHLRAAYNRQDLLRRQHDAAEHLAFLRKDARQRERDAKVEREERSSNERTIRNLTKVIALAAALQTGAAINQCNVSEKTEGRSAREALQREEDAKHGKQDAGAAPVAAPQIIPSPDAAEASNGTATDAGNATARKTGSVPPPSKK